ncbi:hypothetical protein BH11MYX3_BH11MYX3_13150 [soil metagenome]
MRLFVVSWVFFLGCQRVEEKKVATAGSGSSAHATAGSASDPSEHRKAEQIKPPIDITNPPIDSVKTSSGLIYKKLSTVAGAPLPKRNDTVMINYTGWRQVTGETFFSNVGKGQPMPLALANTAPGFTEAMQLIGKGERAMLWLPPEIGYKGPPPSGTAAETLVYEVEVVDIAPAPLVPEDVGKPPANAKKLPSGLPYVVVRPGTAKDKARVFDTVTFNYTAWEATGRMFDSTELRRRPATVPPYRQTAVLEEILTSIAVGERIRVWIPSEKMTPTGKPVPWMPEGLLTYEFELISIAKGNPPPPTPSDVAKPPADAKTTARGVAYKVLKSGSGGPHPGPTDTVKVNYTGWTADGRMFDSSVIKGEPSEMSLNGVIAGFTDGIPLMSVGDRFRFWIPDELAYKGAQGRPQGMLVFDIDLVEIKAAPPTPPVETADPGAAAHSPGTPATPDKKSLPAPPDVAAPPADAKKSPKGAFYKMMKNVPGAKHPTASDTITFDYTGWTTDGKMFDSSKVRGQPLEFPLPRLIPGWIDVIPLLGVGESARFWIPKELAYPDGSGPQGMLVFDFELLAIKGT